MNARRSRAAVLLVALAALLAACSDGKSGPSGPDSPVISNLIAILLGGDCLGGGEPQRLEFDYVDPNGDVSGGHVEVRLRSDDVTFETNNAGVPSSGVTITGTTAGRITLSLCIDSDAHDLEARVRLFDAADNASNELDIDVEGLRVRSGTRGRS
ncbi:MAG: hypothetical protein ACREMB_27715 [Candidatus Rokuibacteriota bacterium]